VSSYDDLICVDDGLWSTQWRIRPRFPDLEAGASAAGPSTPVPGTVTVVEVTPGDRVTAGQTLVVLEAMKMEHRITADADGVVSEVLVEPGQSVDAHQVVAVLAPAEAGT
jgi:propionyl-CoA carboxylase alpha chain